MFETRGEPLESKWPGAVHSRDQAHVSMNREDVGKSGKDRANAAVPFRSLSMHDVRLKLTDFAAAGANATLIPRAQPADFRDVQAVEPDVARQLLWRLHRLLCASDNMHRHLGQTRETL